ncbi:hypothetical protein KTR66_21600 [Roseococcus sp. SDR]|uniref:hypothetical protein n=1 Tax=Roseococcus sp. SDR TaxID=2835532 RepID=UPI001BCB3A16|nr:hypothetical protein [Roseococcus sp. SDR]MBS7792602.1 hypothetical protein [Roseococcus sp. SDR]MBV1847916.1 hypothetical protein [Roseococcus sp. SDR]
MELFRSIEDAECNLSQQTRLRDMVFQAAIFRASAELEILIKIQNETWLQQAHKNKLAHKIPDPLVGYIAAEAFSTSFRKHAFSGNELELCNNIVKTHKARPILSRPSEINFPFAVSIIHKDVAYPSAKNIDRLLKRIGVSGGINQISARLRVDAETLVEKIQSARTALAHSFAGQMTFIDVRDILWSTLKLGRALDQIMFDNVAKHVDVSCWN